MHSSESPQKTAGVAPGFLSYAPEQIEMVTTQRKLEEGQFTGDPAFTLQCVYKILTQSCHTNSWVGDTSCWRCTLGSAQLIFIEVALEWWSPTLAGALEKPSCPG